MIAMRDPGHREPIGILQNLELFLSLPKEMLYQQIVLPINVVRILPEFCIDVIFKWFPNLLSFTASTPEE